MQESSKTKKYTTLVMEIEGRLTVSKATPENGYLAKLKKKIGRT